jgi:hydrogenase maturation protein HypF
LRTHLSRTADNTDAYHFPFNASELDFRPLLQTMADDRSRGRQPSQVARAFPRGIARGLADALLSLLKTSEIDTAALSGGVFQNELLLEDVHSMLESAPIKVWTNHEVPPTTEASASARLHLRHSAASPARSIMHELSIAPAE